jgi:hypothetical protein
MTNLYRGHSKDASYQVLVHLAKRFQRRRFLKIGQSETRIACGVGRKHPWKVLYKDCSFNSDQLTNRPPHAILVFDWLISKKSSPLKPLSQIN